MTTKAQIEQDFKEYVLPAVKDEYEQDGKPDYIARSEAWKDYTDMLCKDGTITSHQYETWTHPACCGD